MSDHEHQLSAALQFFFAAERASAQVDLHGYPSTQLCPSNIVLYSLSNEIIIKLLISLEQNGKNSHEHDITIIYTSLSQKTKSVIKGKSILFPGMSIKAALISSAGKTLHGKEKSAFELWRYAYEGHSITSNVSAIRSFFICLFKSLRQIYPELQSSYEKSGWSGEFGPDETILRIIPSQERDPVAEKTLFDSIMNKRRHAR